MRPDAFALGKRFGGGRMPHLFLLRCAVEVKERAYFLGLRGP
jgi:hypothetical protein